MDFLVYLSMILILVLIKLRKGMALIQSNGVNVGSQSYIIHGL